MLVDTELRQCGDVVSRARTLILPDSDEVDGSLPWTPGTMPSIPPEHLRPATTEGRLFYSEDVGWDADAGCHRNSVRKQVWCRSIPIVEGEEPTPFTTAAAVADLTNLVTHWGVNGVRHFNADVTLVLARDPDGAAIGAVDDRTFRRGDAVARCCRNVRLSRNIRIHHCPSAAAARSVGGHRLSSDALTATSPDRFDPGSET